MGRDKATLLLDGVPLARRVADALVAAGADPVVCVGGDAAAIVAATGLEVVADELGEGPLGGVAAALARFPDAALIAVLGCDLVAASPAAIRALVDALEADPEADVAVPVVGGIRQAMHAVWRSRVAPLAEHALATGDRSVQSVLDRLRVADLDGLDPAWLRDADHPADLP